MKKFKKHNGRDPDSRRILILMSVLHWANTGALDFYRKPTDIKYHLQSLWVGCEASGGWVSEYG